MKTHLLQFLKQDIQLIARIICALVFLVFFGLSSFAQITGTTPASRCGEGTVVLHATAGSGTIKWYDVPFYGTAIVSGVSGDGTTFTTPSLAVTKTYYVDAVDGSNCSLNSGSVRVPVIATISANSIQASIFYASTTFCKSVATAQAVTRTGTAGGVYSFTGSGGTLSLNTSTGAITPSTSTVGTYTVIYTVTAAEGCVENPATTQVTITNAPLTSSISYSGTPFCTSLTSATVSLTNDNSGTFSASPSGLSINSTTGTINPSLSLPGTYTVTYSVSGAGGCAPQAPTTTVTITGLPTATISYTDAPYCKDIASAQTPVITGTGAYTGGTFSATGITINSSTGAITPSTSNAGTYTIYYTIPASGNCASVQVSTSVTINPLPTASIAGTTSVCQNATEPEITFTGLTGTAPFSFTYTVNGGGNQTVTTASGSSVTVAQSTVSTGTYSYSLTGVSDAKGCMQTASGTATVTVSGNPVATFVYPNTPYCKTGTATPMLTGGATAGTFSGTGVTFVSTATGVIDLASTPAGTYTITNTIGGCGNVSAQTTVTINSLPDASISGTLTACGTTTLTANTTNLTPAYTWYKDNIEILGQTSSTLVVDASGAYKVKVSDNNTGCNSTSAASTVTINSIPNVSIEGNLTACGSTVLTAVNDAASPGFIWYKDNVVIADANSSTYTATVSGSYKVKVTSGSGCENTSLASTVTVDPAIVAGSVTGGTTVCTGSNSVDLTLGTYTGRIVRWESTTDHETWTHIDHFTTSYTASNLTATTSFRAVIGSGSCDVVPSNETTITVIPDPSWATITQPATSVIYGSSVTFSATVTGGQGGTISWIRSTTSGGAGTTVTSPNTPPAAGNYYYRPTYTPTGNGCNLADGTETTVTVSPKALTVTATGPTKIYGTALTAGTSAINFTAGATGVGTETVTSVTLTPDAAGLSATTTGGSAYVVTPSLATGTNGFLASNYTITYTAYNGTVAKAESTIEVTGATSFGYSAGVPQGPATVTKTGSTGAVTYSYVGTGSTTYTASATKPTNPGTYTVTATVAADTNYNGKTSAAYAFTIIPLAPTGTATQTFCSSGAN